MRLAKNIAAVPALLLLLAFRGDGIPERSLEKGRYQALKVPEPSDIAVDPANGHLFIVSDNGILYEADADGTVLRRAAQTGVDYEGVEVKGDRVYVSDESARRVYRYDKATLTVDRTYSVPYHGARNSGFESLAWNETKRCFIMVSEQDPVMVYELSEDFQMLNEIPFRRATDVSSARWYGGSMYLLSDEDECILKCDPQTYAVEARYKIAVLNPEGLAFSRDGGVLVTADDLQRLYMFNALPAATHE